MPVVGQLIAEKYRLERFLGSGGFASVWAARNVKLDRPVALKIMADNHAHDQGLVDRFNREATIAAKEIHPTIVRVEDIDQTAEGVPFLVMELLEGRTLKAELKDRGALPTEECVELGRPILEGLAAAHRLAIIHRDIKPANIFLARSKRSGPSVRILDLGLAKNIDDRELTKTGQVMGTPDYLAPEILRGGGREAGPSCDVFSCGVLLFEMLTGRRPLDELVPRESTAPPLFELISFYRQDISLPGPADVDDAVPPALDQLVRRALALDPAQRFLDASEMLEDFELALAAPEELPFEAAPTVVSGYPSQALSFDDETTALAPPRPAPVAPEPPTPAPSAAAPEPDEEATLPAEDSELSSAQGADPRRAKRLLGLAALLVATLSAGALSLLWLVGEPRDARQPAEAPERLDPASALPAPRGAAPEPIVAPTLFDADAPLTRQGDASLEEEPMVFDLPPHPEAEPTNGRPRRPTKGQRSKSSKRPGPAAEDFSIPFDTVGQ